MIFVVKAWMIKKLQHGRVGGGHAGGDAVITPLVDEEVDEVVGGGTVEAIQLEVPFVGLVFVVALATMTTFEQESLLVNTQRLGRCPIASTFLAQIVHETTHHPEWILSVTFLTLCLGKYACIYVM